MLAIAAGQFRGPNYRGLIKEDMDLRDRPPPDATARRAELQRTIDARIDDLVDAADRSRALRRAALSLPLCTAVHRHLVGRRPPPVQLAGYVHPADRVVGGGRGIRTARRVRHHRRSGESAEAAIARLSIFYWAKVLLAIEADVTLAA